jgi:phosphodiesterase/alkaline phosphatase D-like protein
MMFLPWLLCIALCFTLVTGSFAQSELTCKCSSTFPIAADTLDYAPNGYYVRVGLGEEPSKGKILIKGSPEWPTYAVIQDEHLVGAGRLKAPDYIAVLAVNPLPLTVNFQDKTKANTREVKAFPVALKETEKRDSSFSVIFYGCTEPFTLDKDGKPLVVDDKRHINFYMRGFFARVALGDTMHLLETERIRGMRPIGPQVKPIKFQPVRSSYDGAALHQPKLMIGNGDMIYVDAAYEEKTSSDYPHPLRAWSIGRKPQPCLDTLAFKEHLNKMYLYTGSFASLNRCYEKVPLIAIWDDHDIRDGWGSQGDEYATGNGEMNLVLKPYYMSARRAFIDHYYNLYSYQGDKLNDFVESNKDLHQELVVGGKKVFVFDLRSERNFCGKTVISQQQMDAFMKWTDELKKGEECIIVSSIPMFFSYEGALLHVYRRAKPEVEDDLRDAWSSPQNQPQRNIIIQRLLELRIKNDIKPYIVSGDVHCGAILEIWYAPCATLKKTHREKRRVLAYEMVATSLSHETVSDNASIRSYFQKEAEPAHQDELMKKVFEVEGQKYNVLVVNHLSDAKLNFGALDFTSEGTTINLFLLVRDKTYHRRSAVTQNIFKAEWGKTNADEVFWESRGPLQYLKQPFYRGRYLGTASPMHTIKRYFIDENFEDREEK